MEPLSTRSARALVTAGGCVIGGCVAHSLVPAAAIPAAGRTALVVLGFPTLWGGRVHPVQRWRCRLALATAAAHDPEIVLFSGGPCSGQRSEASVMADLARRLGLSDSAESVLEERSTSTWENVQNSRALLDDAGFEVDVIILVSDPLHARRARSYWLQQCPSDQQRVYITDCCGFWDGWWLKFPAALNAAAQSVHKRILRGSGSL